MANHPHVPKFGDWNNQNQPFTAVFENAARNKRGDLYGSIENSETKPQVNAPPPRNPKPEPPKQDTPRAPPPTERSRVRAPPRDEPNKGGGGGSRDGLYGSYGGGGGSGNLRQQQAPPPPRPTQTRPNLRGGSTGTRGATIPPFPGSVGSGENISYTHIFEEVKKERREGRANGGSTGNTPSRPINGSHESPASNTSEGCCFPWCRR